MPYKDLVFAAFRRQQRDAVRLKKIEFLFSFEEWVKWWEDHLGPNWFQMRGRRKDQYCMCRIGDKGPYATWNVECKTCRENCADRKTNGVAAKGLRHGRTKLTEEQVRTILISSRTQKELAKEYGVHQASISKILRGQNWSHFTGLRKLSVGRQ